MVATPLLNKIRELILEGELKAGQRVTEAALAKRLGVSRTPIRSVLHALEADGFLKRVGRRGLAVTAFSDQESLEALELRALLEGYAAKRVANAGVEESVLQSLRECLAFGDKLFKKRTLKIEDSTEYGRMNVRFHELIVDSAQSEAISSMIERLNRIPFVSPEMIVFDKMSPEDVFSLLFRAHGQHHAIVEAIAHRDGSRAESLFREHANGQRHSLFDRRVNS